MKPVFKNGEPKNNLNTLHAGVILDNLPLAIFILDPTGRIIYANNRVLALLDSGYQKVLGRFIDEFLLETKDSEQLTLKGANRYYTRNQHILAQLNQGIFEGIDATLINGNLKISSVLGFNAIYDERNKITHIIVSVSEGFQSNRREHESQKQRALSLFNDRLRALGELSAGLVHELSQPLGGLKLKLELVQTQLKDGTLDEENASKITAEVLSLVNRISSIVSNVRQFASQAEDQTYSMVSVNDAIDNAIRLISFDLDRRGISLKFRRGNRVPFVIERAINIEQVFVNLLRNSIDAYDELVDAGSASSHKPPKIFIFTRAPDNRYIEIVVSDNAGGIKTDIVERIFDPFFTTREMKNKSGVGLTVAKSIIMSMGGDIEVANDYGKGCRFIIRIPVSHKDEREQLLTLIEMMQKK